MKIFSFLDNTDFIISALRHAWGLEGKYYYLESFRYFSIKFLPVSMCLRASQSTFGRYLIIISDTNRKRVRPYVLRTTTELRKYRRGWPACGRLLIVPWPVESSVQSVLPGTHHLAPLVGFRGHASICLAAPKSCNKSFVSFAAAGRVCPLCCA